MKTCRFLFLFFILLPLHSISLSSQNPKDSTTYHYRNILNPENKTDIPNAIEFYTLKKNKHLKSNKYEAISALRLIAIGQFNLGEIIESEKTVVEALKLIDTSADRDTLREAKKGLYNQLGKIYRSNFNFDKAQAAYNNALKYSKTERDSVTIHNNKATIFKDEGEYNKALEELKIALQKKEIQKNQQEYSMVLNNIGFIQTKLLNDSLGLAYIEKAKQIREQINYLPGLYSSYHDLAQYYFNRNDKETALMYANKAYELAKTLNSITYLEDALSLFALMSHQPEVVAYKTIRDSLEKERQLAQNKYAFIKYNVEKEQQKTAEAELAREQEKTQKIISLSLGIIVLIFSVATYLVLRARHKKDKMIQIQRTENRMSKKIHDELANGIYQVMDQVQLDPQQEAVGNQLYTLYTRARDLSRDYAPIDTTTDYSQTLEQLLSQYKGLKTKLILSGLQETPWGRLSTFQKETLYRVLQELMVNMKKHSAATMVALRFEANPKYLTIQYTDNGKGADFINAKRGLGLAHVENRMENIKGQITFESKPGEGFVARINIPI